MKIGHRILLTTGTLVSIILITQGIFSYVLIRDNLKTAARERLFSETKKKVQLFDQLLYLTSQDMATMKSHKALGDFFTSRALNDTDGMFDADFELESFFRKISSDTKPQYKKIQITDTGGKPLLQIEGNKRREVFDRYDNKVRHAANVPNGQTALASHHLFKDEGNGWGLLSIAPIIYKGKTDGYLLTYQSVDNYIREEFSGLSKAGLYYTIADEQGKVVAYSTKGKSQTLCGATDEKAAGFLVATETATSLGLKISLCAEKQEAFKVLDHLLLVSAGVLICSVLISIAVLSMIARNISRPINKLVGWSERLSMGNLTVEDIKITNDEVGELNAGYKNAVNSFKEIASVCEAISGGDFSRTIALKSEKDVIGISVNKMINALSNATQKNKDRDWLKSGLAELNGRMHGDNNIARLSQNIISYLSTYLNAQVGVIYVADENECLKMSGGYAVANGKDAPREYGFGEGLAGQAALERRLISVKNVPDGYIKVNSALGEAAPRNIIVAPLIHEGRVKGVVELGSFSEPTELQTEFLDQALENIAISINSAQSRSQIEELLKETQQQSEELRIQQEELQQTNEELEEHTQTLERQTYELLEKNDQLKKAQTIIGEKAKELELSSKYKSQFLANMSHELRTPLNSLLILSKLLTENKEGNLTEKQVEYAKTVNSAGSDLLGLINDILDLSKIEAGKMTVTFDDVNMDDFIGSIERNFRHVAQEKRLSLTIERSDDAPAYLRTDRQRIEQIVKNFLSNAFKFTHSGGITLSIKRPAPEIDLSRSGLDHLNAVAIAVSDTGIGVPEDKQKLIFEAFQQADGSTSRQYGGTGLGLTISRDLAKLLGGEIQIRSEKGGKGSTFTVYLPERLEAHKTEVNQKMPPAGLHEADVHISKDKRQTPRVNMEDIRDDRRNLSEGDKTVLIIEDDPKFAKILYDLALERGFKGLIACDGEAGLHLADFYIPNAIILDIGLPRINGLAVMERLRGNPKTRQIPVHFISVYDKGREAMAMGALGYLNKPVSMDKLNEAFDKIEQAINKTVGNLLIVEDDEVLREGICRLVSSGDVKATAVATASEAYALLGSDKFDCMILDLGLPDMSGFELLENIKRETAIPRVPTIIYTGQELTEEEDTRLKEFAESIIIKGEKSLERLLDETALFLHRVGADLPDGEKAIMKMIYDHEINLKDKKILVADDDMRNVFALSSILEDKKMKVLTAKNGKEALRRLDENPDTDIVLMDIMMPEMDGYEAMREIRNQQRFRKLPVIAVTAKAMRGDRSKCIEAGASDYLAKPVDIEKLLSLLRVWLYK
ncbi:MAG: response regulator [Nitrospiraceae bacterium]|nr:MAG: response regulator [Nitrospiraceae bacterium]